MDTILHTHKIPELLVDSIMSLSLGTKAGVRNGSSVVYGVNNGYKVLDSDKDFRVRND